MFTLTLHINKEQRQLNCSFDYSMKDSKESLIKKGMTLDEITWHTFERHKI